MSVKVVDFQPLRDLQTARDDAQNCTRDNLSDLVQWSEWGIAKLRSGIQLNPYDLPPRLRLDAILGAVFPHYVPNPQITPLGELQNILHQEDAPDRNAIILVLRAVNEAIPGFSGKVLNQFEAENGNRAVEGNISGLRMAVEHTLLLGFRQLHADQQGQVYGAVYANAADELRNEAFYGENHLLDNWDNFATIIISGDENIHFDDVDEDEAVNVVIVHDAPEIHADQNVGGVMADIAANHQDIRAWAEWDLAKIRNGEALGETDNEQINRVHALHAYAPNIDNTIALGALQEVLYNPDSTQEPIVAAINLMNATFPGFSSAVRKQFNDETHQTEEQYVHQKANVRKAIEHVLLRFVNLQNQQRKAELYLNLPDLLHSWAAFQTAWVVTAPHINPLNLNKDLHGESGNGKYGYRQALNLTDNGVRSYGIMKRQSPQMRTYFYPNRQDQHISGPANDTLLIKLPSARRHLLPLSVQEQLQGIPDDELLLDIHLLDSTAVGNADLLAEDRAQFTLHNLIFPPNSGMRSITIDPHQNNRTTNELNPLQVGMFEVDGMHEPADQADVIKMNELRQENQIIHSDGILSPPNMQTQFDGNTSKFYFVGKWNNAVDGKKAVVSLFHFDPAMNAYKGDVARLSDLPVENNLKVNPFYQDFRRLLGL